MNAWLIEKESAAQRGHTTSLCLGVSDSGKIRGLDWRVEWTTPDLALRFARKEDAEAAAKAMLPPGVGIIPVEHNWEATP